jgi:hypothetical protein
MKKLVFLFCLYAGIISFAYAQDKNKIAITENDYDNRSVEMADTFRKEGKIYVVVGTLGTVLAGIIVYLIVLDRKISKIEQSES